MPAIENHRSSKTAKVLLLGDSGSGKTGACISLAAAGYNLRYIDFDNGLALVRNLTSGASASYPPDVAKRIMFQTFTNKMKNVGGKLVPGTANAWNRAVKNIEHWQEFEPSGEPGVAPKLLVDLGPLTSWTPEDVLVIDSLSFAAIAAFNNILAMNNRLGQRAEQGDWFSAQQLVEGLLAKLYEDEIKCNVVVCAHINYRTGDDKVTRGQVESLGKALSPKVGRYFNDTIKTQTIAGKRSIVTVSDNEVELKSSAPNSIKPRYPIETGLADYFKAIKS